ncbi:DUF4835 family protein [Bizionia gelidisalsuginis]|uniref:DUF4835 family protein n=1 Tax=Bizionia gelidisalsuginis TaxID=291188 RepID=A0ABY3MEA8_9FLAO|nr:DUF4835 family protein [Bizionia gelidisalsuginis]TYC17946.1 DUF4835 family protein [Bizionia gelidisalsuginis]
MRNSILLFLLCFTTVGFAQELNCNVAVNAQLTGNENLQVFKTLENELKEFVTKTQWTKRTFEPQERIDCNIAITIKSYSGDSFSGTIQVQSSRPVYGSSYTTPVYNMNDKEFSFNYIEYQNLIYNPNQYESNLVSVVAFHVYMILGMDAETFEKNGGDPYFKQAQRIVNFSQQEKFKGWKLEDGLQSRFALIDNILSPTFADFRTVMHNYHIRGLDVMSSDIKAGKKEIALAIDYFKEMSTRRPNSYLSRVFFDAKAEEIGQIFSDGPTVDVSNLVDVLNRVAPTHSDKWRTIKY